MTQHLSIIGGPTAELGWEPEDRFRLLLLTWPALALLRSLLREEWFAAAFWATQCVGIALVARFGQGRSRSRRQSLALLMGMLAAGAMVALVRAHPWWRALGGALAIVPFAWDVFLAQRRRRP